MMPWACTLETVPVKWRNSLRKEGVLVKEGKFREGQKVRILERWTKGNRPSPISTGTGDITGYVLQLA